MTDTAIRTLEYEAGVRDQELADLRLRVVQLESAAGFVVRRAELATSESLRERIEALRKALDDDSASTLSRSDGFRYFACELIDAIATPKGRDFRHAWDEACLFFGRFGAEPTLMVPLLRLAEATRLYVQDDDEDRVATWDAMVLALDEALQSCTPTGGDGEAKFHGEALEVKSKHASVNEVGVGGEVVDHAHTAPIEAGAQTRKQNRPVTCLNCGLSSEDPRGPACPSVAGPRHDWEQRCSGYVDTIGRGSQVRCGGVEGHPGPCRHRRSGEWGPTP